MLLKEVRESFPCASTRRPEITLEMDPGTFDCDRLHRLSGLGVNRVSLGVQSFNADLLATVGRAHSLRDTYAALSALTASPLQSNFNVDIISALPHLTLPVWEHTVREAASSGAAHIAVYDLQIEEKPAFGRWFQPGVFPLPTEEVAVQMYARTLSLLQDHGFHHYEVSNYAKDIEHESAHNKKYWQCIPVLAFGMSASSYLGKVRFTRPRLMGEYRAWLEASERQPEIFAKDIGLDFYFNDNDGEQASFSSRNSAPDMLDFVMLSLRTARGLDVHLVQEWYGQPVYDAILAAAQPFLERRLLQWSSNRYLRLTDPAGFLLSNDVISSLFAAIMT
jgi:coproporphyrinogen III oxidase-like Fe-S oxidoreductase